MLAQGVFKCHGGHTDLFWDFHVCKVRRREGQRCRLFSVWACVSFWLFFSFSFFFCCILSPFPFVALLLIGPPEDWFVYVWQDG